MVTYTHVLLGIGSVAVGIVLQGCSSSANPFAPNPAGTLLPNGERWGTWDPEVVEFIGGDDLFETKEVELIASGFRMTEGPTWIPDESALLFSDTIDAKIYRWSEASGVVEILSEQSGGWDGENVVNFSQWFEPGSNGMALVGDQLYINQHPTHRVVRMKLADLKGGMFHDNTFEVLADQTPDGRRLNSPNDVVVATNGDIFFTDPIYGFLIKQPKELGYAYLNAEKGEHPDQKYLDELCDEVGAGIKGVYRIRNGKIELVTDALQRPNGLAFSTDGSTLWVANSDKETPSWTAFPISENLPLNSSTVLNPTTLDEPSMVASKAGEGLSDGFKIDEEGRIWSSTPGGLVVIDPVAKKVLAKVRFGINLSNIRFGKDGDIFVTGLAHLWRLKRKVDSKKMVFL